MKVLKIILVYLLFTSCGYLPDGSELILRKHVVGNIYVEQAKMNEHASLAFELDAQTTSYLVNNSVKVTYDTLNKRIFVEEYLNEWNSYFYQISVLDTVTTDFYKAYNKYKLKKERYDFLISKCEACKEIETKNTK